MTEAIIFAGIAVAIGACLLLRRPTLTMANILFVALLSSVTGLAFNCLGQPKPLWAGCNLTKESTVLGYSLDEGHAIYLWLQTDGAPLSCELPWDEKQAAQINDASGAAKSQGVPLKIKIKGAGKPGQPGTKDDEKPLAYPAPVPPLPPKQGS